jgi:hypothetical protein
MNNKLTYNDWFKDIRPAESIQHSPKENCFIFKFQLDAAIHTFEHLFCRDNAAQLIIGGVGTGKTYVAGKICRDYLDARPHYSLIPQGVFPFCVYPILYITKASILEQTRRVLVNQFGLNPHSDFMLTNYDQLRSKAGELYIERHTKVESGIEYEYFKWKPGHSLLIIADEIQAAKNEHSQQSKVMQALTQIENPLLRILFMSATPFTKVSEAKVICCATKMKIL